jgi:hypothetical protein
MLETSADSKVDHWPIITDCPAVQPGSSLKHGNVDQLWRRAKVLCCRRGKQTLPCFRITNDHNIGYCGLQLGHTSVGDVRVSQVKVLKALKHLHMNEICVIEIKAFQ